MIWSLSAPVRRAWQRRFTERRTACTLCWLNARRRADRRAGGRALKIPPPSRAGVAARGLGAARAAQPRGWGGEISRRTGAEDVALAVPAQRRAYRAQQRG